MHTKRLFLIVLSLIMIYVLFGCKDKSADTGDGYILPETEIFINRHSGGLQDEFKFTYEYDFYGNIVKEERYEKGKFRDIREYCIDRTYTYDENGKITKEIIREEHFRTSITTGGHVSEGGYNYFYNESGQLITKDIIYISAVEDDLCGYKYEYDEYGRLVKKETTHHTQDGSIVDEFISEYKDFVKP